MRRRTTNGAGGSGGGKEKIWTGGRGDVFEGRISIRRDLNKLIELTGGMRELGVKGDMHLVDDQFRYVVGTRVIYFSPSKFAAIEEARIQWEERAGKATPQSDWFGSKFRVRGD